MTRVQVSHICGRFLRLSRTTLLDRHFFQREREDSFMITTHVIPHLAAVDMMTRCASLDLAKFGLRVS